MTKPIIYQMLPRLFMKEKGKQQPCGTMSQNGCGKLNDITPDVLKRIHALGTTHIWYTGLLRHASTTSYKKQGIPQQHSAIVKGKAGSPFAIADYYDVCPDLAVNVKARMTEAEALIERTHQAGMKVIIDFVPNHVARQYQSVCRPKGVADLGEDDDETLAFSPDNNFYYLPGETLTPTFNIGSYKECPARATGNDRFDAHPDINDWYETVKLNYGTPPLCSHLADFPADHQPSTWKKMADILRYWAAKGVDGFRCDMVHMVPLSFWTWCIGELKQQYPHLIFIGENYDMGLYRPLIHAGFDWLYDKVGMYDTLINVSRDNVSTEEISRRWQWTDDIADHMLYFLENHDEQRLASRHLLGDAQAALPAVTVAACLKTNPFMLYFGQELGESGDWKEGFSGEDGRTSIFDYWCMESTQRAYFDRRRMKKTERQVEKAYRSLLHVAATEPAIAQGKMFDLMYVNQHLNKQYAFFRQHEDDLLLIVANFSADAADIHLHIPQHAMEWLCLKEGAYRAEDLINTQPSTPDTFNIYIKGETDIPLHLEGYGAYVYRVKEDKL